MECGQIISVLSSLRIGYPIRFLLLLLILSSTELRFKAEGRANPKSSGIRNEEEKIAVRGHLIGSRPPKCERIKCSWCRHCEAVQVPANPQGRKSYVATASSSSSSYSNGRRDDSNYKPLSWKCKCGNIIFNP